MRSEPILPVAHHCRADCETFTFLTRRWCVTHLHQRCRDLPVDEADITGLDGFVGLAPPPSLLAAIRIDPAHAVTTDLTQPLLIADILDRDGTFLSKLALDGWHRVYHARTHGWTTLPAIQCDNDSVAAAERPLSRHGITV